MTEIKTKYYQHSMPKKREIDWTQYLGYTIFVETEENDHLEKFKQDFHT
ncbi:MAG: hypothetical protein ACFE91_05100 [Promethearchaeota archaeon]